MATATIGNVGFTKPEVTDRLAAWQLVQDCLYGEEAVKAAGDVYLPRPNAADKSRENRARYDAYLQRAAFYNVAQRTHAGLVGQVYQKPPVLELPRLLKVLAEDTDGAGVGLISQSKKALGHVLGKGRCGVLAEYPMVEGNTSRAQQISGIIRPTTVLYEPQQIINWRTRTVGAKKLLSLLTIVEWASSDVDEFESEDVMQWRVLRLDASGNYTVTVYRMNNSKTGAFSVYLPTVTPVDSRRQPFKEIPFQFIGSVNNDSEIDPIPMYDICSLNLSHYRKSADLEELCFMLGQPTPFTKGVSETWAEKVLKGRLQLGSRGLIPLPQGADIGLLQISPTTLIRECMEAQERQMVALGAKLLEQKQVQRTASEARIEYATEISALGTAAANVAQAYQRVLGWCGQFVGDNSPAKLELSVEFELDRMSAEDRAQTVKDWQSKALTDKEMRNAFKKGGLATESDEDWQAWRDSSTDFGVPMVTDPAQALALAQAKNQPPQAQLAPSKQG